MSNPTLTLSIYSLADNTHVATISGADNEACEAKALDMYDPNDYGWSYSPAYGFGAGLIENPNAPEFVA